MEYADAVSIYLQILNSVLPICVVFALGNMCVNMFLSALDGKIHLGVR